MMLEQILRSNFLKSGTCLIFLFGLKDTDLESGESKRYGPFNC